MAKYDEEKKCPKCNSSLVSTTYIDERDTLHRRCERCRYQWNETPIDATIMNPDKELFRYIF